MTLSGTPSQWSGGGRGEFDFAALLQFLREFRSAEQGFAGAQHVFDEAGGKFCGSGSGLLLVDEVGEAEQLRFRIVNGDGEVAGAHEFVDDAVDGGEELLQILRGAGFFGNAIESGAESFGALALGDVAIDGVEGGGLAIDDQRSGGNGNIEQGAVFAAALGFEGEAFAALRGIGRSIGLRRRDRAGR